MSYLTAKSHSHRREFCPMAHTLKQAEINQTRIAEPPLKTLFDLRRVCKRFYFLVNRIVWNIDPASVVKFHLASALGREEKYILQIKRDRKALPEQETSSENNNLIVSSPMVDTEIAPNVENGENASNENGKSSTENFGRPTAMEKIPYVLSNFPPSLAALSRLTDCVWEMSLKLKIARTFQELVLFQRCEDYYDFPELDDELHNLMLCFGVVSINRGKQETFSMNLETSRIQFDFWFSAEVNLNLATITFSSVDCAPQRHVIITNDVLVNLQPFSELKSNLNTMLSEQELLLFMLSMIRDNEHAQKLWRTQSRLVNQPTTCRIRVHRNRLELPRKQLEIESTATLEDLKHKVVALVSEESSIPYYYRFRKISHRKNHTKRPNTIFETSEYGKTLEDLNLRKKQHIYLEQDTSPLFDGLEVFNPQASDNTKILISVRVWDAKMRRPTAVRDFVIHQTMTVGALKKMLSDFINLSPEDMVLVEEETQKQVHLLLDDSKQLSNYGIVTVDILHVEPLCKEHFNEDGRITNSLTQRFFIQQNQEYRIPFSQTFAQLPNKDMSIMVDEMIQFFMELFQSPKWISISVAFISFETFYYLVKAFHRIKAISCLNSRPFEKIEEALLLLRNLRFEQVWHETSTRVSVRRIQRNIPREPQPFFGKQEEDKEEKPEIAEPPTKRRKMQHDPEMPVTNSHSEPLSMSRQFSMEVQPPQSEEVGLPIIDETTIIEPSDMVIQPMGENAQRNEAIQAMVQLFYGPPLTNNTLPHPPPLIATTTISESKEENHDPPVETVYIRQQNGSFRYAKSKIQFPVDKELDLDGWKEVISILGTDLSVEELRDFFQDVLIELNQIDCFKKLQDIFNDSVWSLYPYGDHTQFKYSPNI